MVLNEHKSMCALFMSAGNGNACAQMSQDRKGARKKLQTKTRKIELRANFRGRIGKFRFLYKAWPKVANLHRLALALESHFR